jgi:hypothetical protein
MLGDNDFNSQQSTLKSQPALGPEARRQSNSVTTVFQRNNKIDSDRVDELTLDRLVYPQKRETAP